MTESKNKRTKEFFREWLEKLQQESWQLELLISGLALFGIWESRDMLDSFSDYIDLNATGILSSHFRSFYIFLKVSWTIFFVNLLIHIIVRGLWIGAIGLRYVSGDIDYDELNYAEIFEKFLRKNVGDFDDYIERLEKLSSIIFSFTFLLLFFFISILCIMLLVGISFQLVDNYVNEESRILAFAWITFFILFVCSSVFIDFITFGSLKRVESPIFSKVYFWVYRVVGVLTLSFLYRPLLYNFIDDKYTKRLVIIAVPYILFVSILLPSFGFDAYNYIPTFNKSHEYDKEISSRSFNYIFYDDLREAYAKNNYSEGRNPIIDWVSLDAYEYRNQSMAKIFFHSSTFEDEMFENRFPHLVPFTKKGFRHIFDSNSRENEYIDSITTQEVNELRYMRKIVRGQLEQVTDEEELIFANRSKYYREHDASYLESLTDEIKMEYDQKREEYYEKYLDEMLQAKKSLITMNIDTVDISDDLDCSFFIHPNMGERGILCYFPISSFENGKHDVIVSIERAMRHGEGTTYTNKLFPFIINRDIK